MLRLGLLSLLSLIYFIILATLDSNVAVPMRQAARNRIFKSKVKVYQQPVELYAEPKVPDANKPNKSQADPLALNANDNGQMGYYPPAKLDTVCMNRSTPYNIPRVIKWINHEVINDGVYTKNVDKSFFFKRDLYIDFRKQLFLQAKSEECHVENQTKWRTYLECAAMRNQRMEYMIPRYPLHQVHYHDQTMRVWPSPSTQKMRN